MKTLHISLLSMATVALIYAPGCGDSTDDNPGTTAASSSTGEPSSSSSSTGMPTSSASSSSSGMGGAGTGGSSSSAGGMGGTGGAPPQMCVPGTKPSVDVMGDITANRTLTADNDYLLRGIVHVKAPATLTIEPCTTIMGEASTDATLVIELGAKIHAVGDQNRPIVFTSQAPAGNRAAGDWGGVILLGKAPINQASAFIEGIPPVTGETEYGGTDPMDNSGTMQYVRIEYGGTILGANNEINGLTMGGVGAGTTIDHIQVHHTLDDCFEFFGGTVNAHHLLCAHPGDDAFDFDFGYVGKLQFLALQQDPTHAAEDNGFESDNDAMGNMVMPYTHPTIYNVTLCGQNTDPMQQQYGILSRRRSLGDVANMVATGFESCWDARDAQPGWTLKNSICFGNRAAGANVAYAEVTGGTGVSSDDDGGFDEVAAFNTPTNGNSESDPQITDCFGATPNFLPAATLTTNAATPPNDGFFDTSATYIGAFDQSNNWATGVWVSFAPN